MNSTRYLLRIPMLASLAVAVAWATASGAPAGEEFYVEDLVIVAMDEIDVPALETGLLAEVMVRDGAAIEQGAVIAKIDDNQARVEEALAKTQLDIAIKRADDFLGTERAKLDLSRHNHLAQQHALLQAIAHRKAENEVRVLASRKTEEVAKNELARASRARQEYIDSVSESEIDGLRLAYERTRLETQQAQFEQQTDRMTAESEDQAATIHKLNIQRGELEVDHAENEMETADLQVELRRHEAELARLAVERRTIVAPFRGVVAEVLRHRGQWVQSGEPVLRLVHLDRLRAEGFAPAEWIGRLRSSTKVDLTIHIPGGPTVQREGEIVFVSPEIDSVNNEVRFWVEFANDTLDVLPGMRLSVRSKQQ